MEMGEVSQKKVKVPRRTIYFASGETMEEYSTDEDEEVEPVQKDVLPVDTVGQTYRCSQCLPFAIFVFVLFI